MFNASLVIDIYCSPSRNKRNIKIIFDLITKVTGEITITFCSNFGNFNMLSLNVGTSRRR